MDPMLDTGTGCCVVYRRHSIDEAASYVLTPAPRPVQQSGTALAGIG